MAVRDFQVLGYCAYTMLVKVKFSKSFLQVCLVDLIVIHVSSAIAIICGLVSRRTMIMVDDLQWSSSRHPRPRACAVFCVIMHSPVKTIVALALAYIMFHTLSQGLRLHYDQNRHVELVTLWTMTWSEGTFWPWRLGGQYEALHLVYHRLNTPIFRLYWCILIKNDNSTCKTLTPFITYQVMKTERTCNSTEGPHLPRCGFYNSTGSIWGMIESFQFNGKL
jgi:hypothetical protein